MIRVANWQAGGKEPLTETLEKWLGVLAEGIIEIIQFTQISQSTAIKKPCISDFCLFFQLKHISISMSICSLFH